MKLKYNIFLRCLSMLLLVGGLSSTALAQRTITGTILDAESGDPLIGANVLVVGTSAGTVTDIDGKYSLNVPAGATQVEISYTGFATQTIEMGASNVMDFKLAAGELLDEIVVVGYGSVRKKDATGAVTTLTSKDFNGGVISSPEQLIQGRAAGVQITNSSGEPGAGVNIRIRGTSSVRSDNNPLFVVDGVPLSGANVSGGGAESGLGKSSARNPLNFINPNDIANIDILKDASATAIYGSRGANGVVLITTKDGMTNEGRLEYGYALGVSTITKKYDLLGADEFLDGYETFNPGKRADVDGGADTDWQDEIFRTALSHSHNVSYGGGNKDGNYRFSMGYLDQEGIVETSGLKRLTGRFNGTKNFIDDRLKIGTQFTVANVHDDNVAITDNAGFEGDLLGAALKANPTQAIREDGELVQIGVAEPNPVAILELSDSYTNTLRALGSVSAELQIIDGLSFKTVVGFDRSASERIDAFSPDLVAKGIQDKGRLFTNDIRLDNKLWENYFTYKTEFGGNIDFTGLLGYSYQQFDVISKSAEYTNFRTNDLNLIINNLASANQGLGNSAIGANSSRTEDELQSYFGRLNFGISDKYLVTLTMRADGSTRFGGDNKYGYFPSAAFKWRLIEEDFVPDFFDDLGLRLGYGVTGNQELPHNAYQARFRYNDWDINDDDTPVVNGGGLGTPVAAPNPALKWETTSQINVGLDFAFASTRVSGTLDFYRKDTKDLLFKTTSAQPAASEFVFENLDANIINTGIELGLDIAAITKGNLRWNVLMNVAYNENEVTNFGGLVNTGDIDGQGLTGAFAQRIAEGQPLFAYFLRDFGGFDDNGLSIYNGAGDVQTFTGDSPLPSVIAGLTNSFTYGNLDFSIFFSGQFGQYVYSNTANAYFTAGALASGRNVTKDVVGNGESRGNSPDVSTRFLENASFVRLQNVSIGYNFDINSDAISSLRLYVTGQNLAIFTGYSGQDPEVDTNKAIDGIPSAGIDYTPFPRARTFTLGANVSF